MNLCQTTTRIKVVEAWLQHHFPGCWQVSEEGDYNKLLIRLKDQAFFREKKYGRGIPTKHVCNYLRVHFVLSEDMPEFLGRII